MSDASRDEHVGVLARRDWHHLIYLVIDLHTRLHIPESAMSGNERANVQ